MVTKFYTTTGSLIIVIGVIVTFISWLGLIGEDILPLGLATIAAIAIFLYFLFSAMIFFAIGNALHSLKRNAENTEKLLIAITNQEKTNNQIV